MLPVLQRGGLPPPTILGPGPAASPGRARVRPATSRCCARPAGTVPQHGGLPPPIPPGPPRGGLPPPMTPGRVHPARIVPDRGPRPARTRCSWGLDRIGLAPPPRAVPDRGPQPARTRCWRTSGRTVLQHGGLPPPIPPGPARPASCPTCPPSPVRAGLLRPPARTRCCTRPGSAALGRPASPGLRPSLVPVRPAKSPCSWGPGRTDHGRTGLQRGGLPRPMHPGSGPGPRRARPPASRRCSRPPGRTLPAPAGSAHTDRARTGPARTGLRFPLHADRSDRVRTPPGRPGRTRAGPNWPSRSSRAGPGLAGPAALAGRTGRARSARTRPGWPRGVRVRTTPGGPLLLRLPGRRPLP